MHDRPLIGRELASDRPRSFAAASERHDDPPPGATIASPDGGVARVTRK